MQRLRIGALPHKLAVEAVARGHVGGSAFTGGRCLWGHGVPEDVWSQESPLQHRKSEYGGGGLLLSQSATDWHRGILPPPHPQAGLGLAPESPMASSPVPPPPVQVAELIRGLGRGQP